MGTKNTKSKKKVSPECAWKDRKHWAWFPFSFTVYSIVDDRLNITRGFFSKVYDETLLYRISDITLRRSFAQRIFGTGTIVLNTLVDHDKIIELKNIKNSVETRHLLSHLIEESRRAKNVVGKEFYSSEGSSCGHPELHEGGHGMPSHGFDGPDMDGSDFDGPDFDGPGRS